MRISIRHQILSKRLFFKIREFVLAGMMGIALLAFVDAVPLAFGAHAEEAARGNDLAPLTDIVSTAAGGTHTCALTTSGGVKCWGRNEFGQLGDGTVTSRTTPVGVIGLGSRAVSIAAGGAHTCAVLTSGAVRCWGLNEYGQIGDGTRTNRNSPVEVIGLGSNAVDITAGSSHSCVRMSDGGVKCWGYNRAGRLGDGTETDRTTPVAVAGLNSGVARIAAGWRHTCAVTTEGAAKCWGLNDKGQLGDGTQTDRTTPVNVDGLSAGVDRIIGGGRFTCAVTTGGAAKCWGYNSYGQLGDGSTVDRTAPVNVTSLSSGIWRLAAAGNHACALTTSGNVKCWGRNLNGRLGDGTEMDSSTPVNVVGLTSGVTSISADGAHTCATTSGGTVKCWGENDDGQLGDGTTVNRITPAVVLEPSPCYSLARSHVGNGADPVASPSSSAGCNTGQFMAGESITLTASPASGWQVIGWSGTNNDSSGSSTNTLTMPANDHTVTVTYGVACNILERTHSGSGADPIASPSRSDGCGTGEYVVGEAINLTASPAVDWTVAGWSGTDNDASASIYNSLIMPARAAAVGVTYVPVPQEYSLSRSIIGNGTISVSPNQPTYPEGTAVSLTATPAADWLFAGWSGDASGTANPYTIIMNGNKSVVATFEPESSVEGCHFLRLTVEGNGAIPVATPARSAECNTGDYLAGEAIALRAAPAPGWRVAGWSGTDSDASANTVNSLRMPGRQHTVGVRYVEEVTPGDDRVAYLPLVRRDPISIPTPFPALVNGNFDRPGDTSWRMSSNENLNLIVDESYVAQQINQPFSAHSSPRLAWLGGFVDEQTMISQDVDLTGGDSGLRLSFYHWIAAEEGRCGDDRGFINVNGATLRTFDLCAANNTAGWTRIEVSLGQYAGQSVTLSLLAEQDGDQVSNWYIDDVVLCDGTSRHPCQ